MEHLIHLLPVAIEVMHVENLRDKLHEISSAHPILAMAAATVALLVLTSIVVANGAETIRLAKHIGRSGRGLITLTLGALAVFVVAAASVFYARNYLAPVPILDPGEGQYLRKPVGVRWSYRSGQAFYPIVYELGSLPDSEFKIDVTKQLADGRFAYSYQMAGQRFWRVRATKVDGKSYSGWSNVVSTVQFPDYYSRIIQTKPLTVSVSNSVNQGAFKFLDRSGRFSGIDIEIAKSIADEIGERISEPKSIKVVFWPVEWEKLLKSLKDGDGGYFPDAIISTISKRYKRESQFGIRFSGTYFCTRQAVVFPSTQEFKSLKAILEGKAVGHQKETTSSLLVSRLSEIIKFRLEPFDQADLVLQALQ